jgi:hypothetical protein
VGAKLGVGVGKRELRSRCKEGGELEDEVPQEHGIQSWLEPAVTVPFFTALSQVTPNLVTQTTSISTAPLGGQNLGVTAGCSGSGPLRG